MDSGKTRIGIFTESFYDKAIDNRYEFNKGHSPVKRCTHIENKIYTLHELSAVLSIIQFVERVFET